MEEGKGIKLIIWGIGIIISLFVVWLVAPFAIIRAGERGVVLRWGAVERILSEGLNWRTPIVESVEHLDVKTQKIEVDSSAASKDLQTVHAKIALNFHLEPDRVGDLWKTVGAEYAIRIIDPAIQESVKAATAKFTAEELVTKREIVKDSVKEELRTRLARNYIAVDELNIVDFNFSNEFNAAIEAKVTAEQQALAAKNKLEQVKFEAEQRVTQAKAEAEAIRIQAQAITQQGGEDYVRLKMTEKWDGKLPVNLYGNAPIPFLNLK